MNFKLRGEISEIEEIAEGESIRILPVLQKLYGKGRWRKLKGIALVELPDGSVNRAESTTTRKAGGLMKAPRRGLHRAEGG